MDLLRTVQSIGLFNLSCNFTDICGLPFVIIVGVYQDNSTLSLFTGTYVIADAIPKCRQQITSLKSGARVVFQHVQYLQYDYIHKFESWIMFCLVWQLKI